MLVILVIAAWQGLGAKSDAQKLCTRIAIVALLMLLLSPTVWPWYYVALLPLATVATARTLLLAWTVLLPLNYLPGGILPDQLIACIVHLPIWVLLCVHFRREAAKGLLIRNEQHG